MKNGRVVLSNIRVRGPYVDVDVRVAPTCLPSACGDVDGGCDVRHVTRRAGRGRQGFAMGSRTGKMGLTGFILHQFLSMCLILCVY